MARINDILHMLHDGASTTVDIPTGEGELKRFNSVYKRNEPPAFELFFPPNSWEVDEFPPGTRCHLSVNHLGRPVNLSALIDAYSSDRRILFMAEEALRPEELREYFRVAIHVSIRISPAVTKHQERSSWQITGTTVDLSGSGVLVVLPERPPSNQRLLLELLLPDQADTTLCQGHVVHTYRLRKGRYQVAFHFDDITSKARDQIIAACLQEQRRQLRDNVQTL